MGFFGYLFSSNITITNSSIQRSNIKSFQEYVGCLVGYSNGCKYIINNISVQTVRIQSTGFQGIILGLDFNHSNTFMISSSSSSANYINEVLQPSRIRDQYYSALE
ncbi:Hypothetical_protein [Hexamita inflata]|uniref:Hypothetical_protein n=1 Tax=Hexamita inflata TaxID=28002 RepID=A0AA86R4S7_9EUKA|nr:Hypothetical protein HINF_LOCUS53768 [Hexamita inflata]